MKTKKNIFILFLFLLNSPFCLGKINLSHSKKVSEIKLVTPYTAISKKIKKIPIGLWITLNKGWHSYGKYPGDTGKALNVKWTLPKGYSVSPLKGGIPTRFKFSSLNSFIYKNNFLLTGELSLPKLSANINNPVNIIAQVTWFVCKKLCIPFSKKVTLNLKVQKKSKINPYWDSLFNKWAQKIPTVIKHKITLKSQKKYWLASLITHKKLQLLDVFPLSKNSFSSAKPTVLLTNNHQHSVLIKKIKFYPHQPATQDSFSALAIFKDKKTNKKLGFIYNFITKTDPLMWFVLLAFLGGLILNAMPCVLPIVFLKFSNTIEQAKQKKSEIILSNLFYSAGVISSFMLLAIIILLLQMGGQSIGWGFQMQSPYFLLTMIFIFTLVSFNFMGWFSAMVPSMSFFHRGTTYTKHFLTGILSTTAASPCTVPFMGAAIGYAFLGNIFHVIIIFFFLGLGLSFPYLLLSIFPHWIKYIPKPGKWSSKLKTFMAFPALASSIWLIDILNKQHKDIIFMLLLSLLCLTFSFWILHNLKKKSWIHFLFRIFIFISLIYPFFYIYKSTNINTIGINWEPFSIKKVNQIRQKKEALFINFTANWCLTCSFNKQITFKNKKVVQFFKDKKIHALKGDWSHKNIEISNMLKQYHRSGIPFYLYFPPKSNNFIILPEIITPNIFFKYINQK